MRIALVFACLVGVSWAALVTNRPCEDAPIDCATKDKENGICRDPIDSLAYCPRYCGKCQGPTPAPTCRDFDQLCSTLANSNYCQLNIARQLCADSCGFCEPPTTTTTTTEAPTTTTTEETTTTPIRYTEVPDPRCQDVDPDCSSLLKVHFCGQEPLVSKLCQRSCGFCPTILVQVTDQPDGPTRNPDVSTQVPIQGPTAEAECKDHDVLCAEPSTPDNCTTDELLRLLCPLTCGVCGGIETTTMEGQEETTLAGLPDLDPFSPSAGHCTDNDPECSELIQIHDCQKDQIVIRLCPASCGICTTPATGATGTNVPAECRDYSSDCDRLAPGCSFDPLVVRLCREACNAYPCTPESVTTTENPVTDVMTTINGVTTAAKPETTMAPEVTTQEVEETTTAEVPVTIEDLTTQMMLPSLNPFSPSAGHCTDNDPECRELIQIHDCQKDQIVIRLCPASCGICKPGTTPTTGATGTNVPAECRDYSSDCDRLAPGCSFDPLVVRLCREACNAYPCTPEGVTTTENPVTDDLTTNNGVTTAAELETTMAPEVTTQEVAETTTAEVPVTTEDLTTQMMLPSLNPDTLSRQCRDLDPQCDSLVQSFFCDTNQLLQRICPDSCGLCDQITPGEPGTGNVTIPSDLTCRDFDPQCPDLVAFCERTDLLVNRLCRLSCNECDTETTTPVSTPEPETTPKPTPSAPLTCRICVDPFCEKEIESVRQCSAESPYCSSQIINNADGTHGLTKRCASKMECDGWYTSRAAGNSTLCNDYDPNTIVQTEFFCYYCCTTPQCNRHAKPDLETLYTP